MKLLNILLNEVLDATPEFNQEVSKLKDQGATFIGQGDYGKVFKLGDKIVKITSDSDEILHVKLLKGKKTNNFVYIYDIRVINDRLAVITMEDLGEFKGEVPQKFIQAAEQEAEKYGIDSEELDFIGDNIMIDPITGNLKMVDV